MFEDKTAEAIKEQILNKIQASSNVSVMPGSFADAVAGPVAEAMSEVYQTLPGVPSMLFVDEGSGPFIDAVAGQNFNLTRRPGTRARGAITLNGDAGTVVNAGTVFLTATGLEYALIQTVIIGPGGSIVGELEAAQVGSVYNLEAGAIVRMYVNLIGLQSFSSGATSGGTDAENDAILLGRIDERRKRPPTSGNAYHYRAWAMEVAGVGNAKVVQLASGPGTVGVTVIDSNYQPASAEILSTVISKVEENRPIGAEPTIASAAALSVNVEAVVSLVPNVTPEQVKEEFIRRLEDYRRAVIEEKYDKLYAGPSEDLSYYLIYNRVAALLLTIPGVLNYFTLKLNGPAADVSVAANQIPTIGEVVISV